MESSEKDGEMPEFVIVASLPFPLRVDSTPYHIEAATSIWSIVVQRIPREPPDERIAGPGTNADLLIDRLGQMSYSRVTGSTMLDGTARDALSLFLVALNSLIQQVRDLFGDYWIRTLDAADLYQVQIRTSEESTAINSFGRRQGLTPPQTGLTEDANGRLLSALARGETPPVWRQMHLDARDALELGRYEDCVVLTWSALESACRSALPGMAHRAGLTVADFANLIDPSDRRLRRAISYEEILERTSGGLKIVNASAVLTQPQIYLPDSVTNSVRLAFERRNKIVHQGVRVSSRDAWEIWQSVESAFTFGLTLRDVTPPPPLLSWRGHFKRAQSGIQAFIARTGKRLVLSRPRWDDSPFTMQLIGDELWLRLGDALTQPMAIALVLAHWDSWNRGRHPMRPQLRSGETGGLFLDGLVDGIAREVQQFVVLAESMLSVCATHPAMRDAAAHVVTWQVAKMASEPTIAPDDQQWVIRSTILAAHLILLPRGGYARRLQPLRTTQPLMYRASIAWAETLTALDPDDEHSSCRVLRRIHDDTDWLDTIMVICPSEQLAYGSRSWPLIDAPLRR